jgi:hypothetical protein
VPGRPAIVHLREGHIRHQPQTLGLRHASTEFVEGFVELDPLRDVE